MDAGNGGVEEKALVSLAKTAAIGRDMVNLAFITPIGQEETAKASLMPTV